MKETRHELDAVFTINVTAREQMVIHDCPMHGGVKEGYFPSDIKATVQYGKNLQALIVAFNTVGAMSINRAHEILSSVFSIPLSTGTIKNIETRCADSLADTYERIRCQMIRLSLLHCDETGTRVDGKTRWVHSASDIDYTFFRISKNVGRSGWMQTESSQTLQVSLSMTARVST